MRLLIRILCLAVIIYECAAFNITHHRRAHRHERSRHRRQYVDETGRPFVLTGGQGSESGPWSPWSEPTVCSRTCGGGVSYQERRCGVENACTGASRRYFSCNIQACPDPTADFRAEQCAAYNSEEFEGIAYDWVPYTKADNKCQLNCMPRGERFYYRHQDKVHDGTLCRSDSLDICVDGECMPVGCDHLLGSTTKEDNCRVCGGDGSTCTTTEGVIDTNDLISGYNDLLLIPEGATNIRVTERRPSGNYLAIRNKTGHYYLNGNWRIDFPKSLQFAGTVFTYIRKPFGFFAPETITALGPTNEAILIVLLYQEKNPGIEYSYSLPKGTVHETSPQGYGWQFGEWSPCNATCGNGFQQRDVWCALRHDSSRVTEDLCDSTTQPTFFQHCSVAACPPEWNVGPWGPCSVTCSGNGTQTRQIYCAQDDGTGRPTLANDDSVCNDAGPKPESTQKCEETTPCPTWHIGPWKPCSHLCGDGKQTRAINCHRKIDGKIELLEKDKCGGVIPESEKPCNIRPCEGLDWITGEWSGCDDKCGLAFETRTAYCANAKGKSYPDSMCHSYRKPVLVRNCTFEQCASQWFASQWSACSAKCGTGVQTRSVFCATFEGDTLKKVDDSKCDPVSKYLDKQECKVDEECKGEWFYGPYSSCSKPCGGGIMARKMVCVKNNKTVDISECSVETIGISTSECNKQPCGEDELLPVNATESINEDYDEYCEEYDYEDITDENLITVDSKLDSSTEYLAAHPDSSTFGEEEGSGGYSDDLITVKSSEAPNINTTKVSTSESNESEGTTLSIGLTTLSSGISIDSSTEMAAESTTLSDLITTFISDISSSVFFSTTASSAVQSSLASDGAAASSSELLASTDDFLGDGTASPTELKETSGGTTSLGSSEISTESSISKSSSSSDSPIKDSSTYSTVGESSSLGVSPESSSIGVSPESSTSGVSPESSSIGVSSKLSSIGVSPESSTSGASPESPSSGVSLESSTISSSPETSPIDITSIGGSTDLTTDSTPESSTLYPTPDSSSDSSTIVSSSELSTDLTSASSVDMSSESSSESSSSDISSESLVSTSSESIIGTSLGHSISISPESSSIETSSEELSSPHPSSASSDKASSSLSLESTTTLISEYSSTIAPDESTISSTSGSKLPGVSGLAEAELASTTVKSSSDSETSTSALDTTTSDLAVGVTDSSTPSVLDASSLPASEPPTTDTSNIAAVATSERASSSSVDVTSSSGIEESSPVTSVSTELSSSLASSATEMSSLSSHAASFGITTSPESSTTAETSLTSSGLLTETEEDEDKTEIKTTSYTEAVFGYSTVSSREEAVSKELKKVCKVRRKRKKCLNSEFGCCPDNKTSAKGPFGKDCPMPKTCFESEFGCCPDEVSPAKGKDGEGCPPTYCEQTIFGCCQDGITPAIDNDFAGCPVDETTFIPGCQDTEFGCCPDGILSATGPNGLGCPGCNETEFGCCPDGITSATGLDYFGCDTTEVTVTVTEEITTELPENVTAECEVSSAYGCCPDGITESLGPDFLGCICSISEFGCCPDGNTTATGPNNQGCPPSCGQFGCCDDNVTQAHGPNQEGCCLLTAYGCCPDNIIPAQGPNLEGCGCQYSPYGCCPDGQKAATGPSNKGCGCKYTTYGCCPNMYTPASGPDYQGCPCNTHQFGCCPDGVTIPTGPRQQGCGCYYSTYGCCSDEKTPAPDVFKNCSCEATKFGCCLDGQTEAKGENFEGCDTKPVHIGESCALPRSLGECRNLSIKWFFDMEYGGCARFWYGGCGGNGNRFETAVDCKDTCVSPKGKDRCYLPKSPGPCTSYILNWYYDPQIGSCAQFAYSGCLGNTNRFETREECEAQCGTQSDLDVCEQRIEPGPCQGNFTRWYYDKEAQSCSPFQYGGCKGTQNNFLTEASCKMKCLQPDKSREECSLAQEKGTCDERQPKWFFKESENRCAPFHYSGCGGNGNNFNSREECEQMCPPKIELDICMLPAVEGPCDNYTLKYFYDVLQKGCRNYYYGGCGGNSNNFNTLIECQQRCDPGSLPKETPVQFSKDMCFLPSESGNCASLSEIKWFYNSQEGICKQFQYSGCGGNGNRFESRNECEYSCLDVQDVCDLPLIVGPCNGFHKQWHYDKRTRTCQAFDYGGCQGNGNRFDTEEDCRSRCIKDEIIQTPAPAPAPSYQDICYFPSDTGPCTDYVTSWYYESRTGDCREFSYGGCKGNANRFMSQEQCERQCGVFKGQDPCSGNREVGTCSSNIQKIYFDIPSQSCIEYFYSGCGGNPNRFSSVSECQSICLQYEEPPRPTSDPSPAANQAICSLPREAGICDGSHARWHFEPARNSCLPFTYSGCAGNLNNFISFQECNDFCFPVTRDPSFNEIDVDDPKKKICAETERRCSEIVGCQWGLEQWVDNNGCSACRCHNPCIYSPPVCPAGHTCRVEQQTDPQTGQTQHVGACKTDLEQCPIISTTCTEECKSNSDCSGNLTCCYNGCGTVCYSPQPEEPVTRAPPHFPGPAGEPPRISEETPAEEISEEGNYVTFNCIAYGRPTPTVVWYRGDEELGPNHSGGGHHRILENGTLQIIGLDKSDAGIYTCRASNGIQPDASRPYTLRVLDGVMREAAILGEDNSDFIVTINRPATLKCFAYGWPRPAVTWWYGPRMLPLSSDQLEQRRDNTLLVRNVLHFNLGYYTCQAYNGLGKAASWTVGLKVVGPITLADPNDVTYNQFVLPAPRIPTIPEERPRQPTYPIPPATPRPPPEPVSPEPVTIKADVSVESENIRAGQNFNMTCTNQEGVRVTWYKDNALITLSDRIYLTDNALVINNASVEDSGQYKCEADNGFMRAQAVVNINVQEIRIPARCTDSPFLANCKLIVKGQYCNHKFYAKFCCRSCTEAGQLPIDATPDNYSIYRRKRRFAPDRIFRIPPDSI